MMCTPKVSNFGGAHQSMGVILVLLDKFKLVKQILCLITAIQ